MTASRSLKSRTTTGAVWTALQLAISYALRLCSNLILARLLAPEAFGLIGLTMAVVTALYLLSDIGISQSIVREAEGDTPPFLHAAWRAKILRGLVITATVLLCAVLLWQLGPTIVPPDSVCGRPSGCKRNLGYGWACDQVRSCVRPRRCGLSCAAGLYGDMQVGTSSLTRAQWRRAVKDGSSDPVS
jgi:hypothetical protein